MLSPYSFFVLLSKLTNPALSRSTVCYRRRFAPYIISFIVIIFKKIVKTWVLTDGNRHDTITYARKDI